VDPNKAFKFRHKSGRTPLERARLSKFPIRCTSCDFEMITTRQAWTKRDSLIICPQCDQTGWWEKI
jgi:hypothetical protein